MPQENYQKKLSKILDYEIHTGSDIELQYSDICKLFIQQKQEQREEFRRIVKWIKGIEIPKILNIVKNTSRKRHKFDYHDYKDYDCNVCGAPQTETAKTCLEYKIKQALSDILQKFNKQ